MPNACSPHANDVGTAPRPASCIRAGRPQREECAESSPGKVAGPKTRRSGSPKRHSRRAQTCVRKGFGGTSHSTRSQNAPPRESKVCTDLPSPTLLRSRPADGLFRFFLLNEWDLPNHAHLEWFGRTPRELVGISMRTLLGPLGELNRPCIHGGLNGANHVCERRIPPAEGSVRESIAPYTPDGMTRSLSPK